MIIQLNPEACVMSISACAILAAPERFLEKTESPPVVTPESATKALTLLDQAAMSGKLRLDDIQSIAMVQEGTARNKEEVETSFRLSVESPGKARRWTTWDTWSWGEVLRPDEAFFVSGRGPSPMVESQRQFLERKVSRNLVMVIRARRQEGTPHLGREELDGKPAEAVAVHRFGGTTKALIDPESGKIVALRYSGRGPSMTVGAVHVRLSNYTDVGGVTLPMTLTASFDGKPCAERSFTYASIQTNCVASAEFEKSGKP